MTYYWWIHWFWITSLNVYYCFPFSSVDTYQQQEKIYSKREPLKFPLAVESDTDDIFDGREITDSILRDTTKWHKNVIIPASTSLNLMHANINQILENVSDDNAMVKQTVDKSHQSPAVVLNSNNLTTVPLLTSTAKPITTTTTTTEFANINNLSLTNKTAIDLTVNNGKDSISNNDHNNNSNYSNNKSKTTINVASNDLKNSTLIIRTPATLILQSATITTAMDGDSDNNNNYTNFENINNNKNNTNDSDNNNNSSDFNNVAIIDDINNNMNQSISDKNNTSPSSPSVVVAALVKDGNNNMKINMSKLEMVSDKYNKKLATINQMNNKYNNNNNNNNNKNNDNNFTVTNNRLTNVRKNEENIFTTTESSSIITAELLTERNRISKILSQYKELNFDNFSTETKNVLARSAASLPISSDLDDGTEDNLTSEALSIKPTNVLVAGAISGICIGVIVLFGFTGTVIVILYRRRYMNNPQTLSEPDSSGYIDDSTIRDNSDEMYSLDNDSFLNSLEAMTIQNYWTDSVKHTKL